MRPRKHRSHLLPAVAVSLLLLAATAPGATASARCGAPARTVELGSDEEAGRLVGLINETRRIRALAPLVVSDELAARARSWSQQMARAGAVSHSGAVAAAASTERAFAENVGCDVSVEAQHRALVDSPSHYANMVQPGFTHVGVGLARAPDGMLYTTELFRSTG